MSREDLSVKRKGRKADITSLFLIMILVFIFMLVTLVSYTALARIQTANTGSNSPAMNSQVLTDGLAGVQKFDYGALIAFVFMVLGVAASAWAIKTNPIALPFVILIAIVAMILSGSFSNMYYAIASSDAFVAAGNIFTTQLNFSNNLPYYVMGAIFIIMFAMFAKQRLVGENGG